MNFSRSLKTCKNEVENMPTDQIVKMILSDKTRFNDNPVFEIIDEHNEYVKPYFDFEMYSETNLNDSNKKDYVLKIKAGISQILQKNDLKFATSYSRYTSHDEKHDNLFKISFHATITNYKIKYASLQKIISNNKKLMNENFFDMSVYSKYQKFRVVCTSKKGKQAPLTIHENNEHADHFITNPKSDHEIIFNEKYYGIRDILDESVEHHYDDYKTWATIGGSIKNIDFLNGDEKIRLFDHFSKKSTKYINIDDVKRNFDLFKFDKLGLESLTNILSKDKTKKEKKILLSSVFEELADIKKNKCLMKYAEMKNEIEETYFILESNSKICKYEDDTLYMYQVNNAQTLLKPYYWKNQKDNIVYFCDEWLRDSTRRSYKGIIFDPQCNNTTHFNLFTGFKFKNYKNIDTSVNTHHIHKLLKHVLLLGYDYLLDWMAFILQNKKKTNNCVILYSNNHGVGKNLIVSLLCKLIDGKKYTSKIDSINDFEKDFNSDRENKFLIYGDEIIAKSKDIYNTLKNVITQDEILINKKGIDAYKVKDLCNYIFTTNHYAPIKIEQNDRRMSIIECNEDKMIETDYTLFVEQIKDDNILKLFFDELMARKIPNVMTCFESDSKKDIQNLYIPSVIKYIFKNMNELNCKFVKTGDLYKNIKNFESENKYSELCTERDMKVTQVCHRVDHKYATTTSMPGRTTSMPPSEKFSFFF